MGLVLDYYYFYSTSNASITLPRSNSRKRAIRMSLSGTVVTDFALADEFFVAKRMMLFRNGLLLTQTADHKER